MWYAAVELRAFMKLHTHSFCHYYQEFECLTVFCEAILEMLWLLNMYLIYVFPLLEPICGFVH